MMLMCVADILEEEINNDLLKGLLAFDATLGINLGPRSLLLIWAFCID